MAAPPKIAVLIATFNGAAHIEEQIRSIAGQVDVQPHIFLRDDGSSDDTVASARLAAEAGEVGLTVLEDRLGASGSAGANFLILLRDAPLPVDIEYLAFADQDDIWLSKKLSRAVERLQAEWASGYSCNLVAFDERTGRTSVIDKAQRARRLDYLFQSASAGCTYVLDRAGIEAARKPLLALPEIPRAVSHDWYVYAACRAAGLGWYLDTEALIRYRQHGANVEGARRGLFGSLRRLRQSRSGWYRWHIGWLAQTLALDPRAARVASMITRLSWPDRLRLVLDVKEMRRSRRDRIALAALILAGQI